MRAVSDDLKTVIEEGGFQSRLITDVVYGGERTMANVPTAEDWSFTFDLESETKSDGKLTVLYQGDHADSLTPRRFLDRLAPFGQQVVCLLEVSLGRQFREAVPLVTHRINETPEAADLYMRFGEQILVRGSRVELGVDDLLFTVARDVFPWPSPVQLPSTWAEMQRISGLTVDPSLPDVPSPELIYDVSEGGRLKGLQMLATTLGGTAYTTPSGDLSVIPFTPGDPVTTLRTGVDGRVLEVPRAFSSEGRYNRVVGKYQAEDGTPIIAKAEITTGALAVGGPFRPYTFLDTDERVKTQADASVRVQKVLARLRDQGTYRLKVRAMLDPRLEFGDVVILDTAHGEELGRIVRYDLAGDAPNTMDLSLDVNRDAGVV